MKIVGLTGGIGSGKTTIAKMFEKLGVAVYYADDEAKQLMNTSVEIKKELIDAFGERTYKNGTLNRAYLADLIFNDKEKLQKVNSIVHPKVDEHFQNWVDSQSGKFVIQENAILFESNKQDKFDFIITVTAPKKVKLQRVIDRDHSDKNQVIARMNNQLEDSFKIDNSNFVIYNTDLKQVEQEVRGIYDKLFK